MPLVEVGQVWTVAENQGSEVGIEGGGSGARVIDT